MVVVVVVGVVIGVNVECGASGGGGDDAVALLALATPISPHHLRNTSWRPSPLEGHRGMATLGCSSPCGRGRFRVYIPLYRVQGTKALGLSQQPPSTTSERVSDASYASWTTERDGTPSGARTGGDGARARRA